MTEIPSPTPVLTMTGSDMSDKTDPATTMAASQGIWTTPTSQGMRPRPATIHDGFQFCMAETYDGMTSWDSSTLSMQQTPSDTMSSRPISVHQEFYPPTTLEGSKPTPVTRFSAVFSEFLPSTDPIARTWTQKPCDDSLELQLDSDMNIGQAYTTDEAIPILDLRYSSGAPMDGDTLNFEGGLNPRRLSGSSFTMSTTGGLSDMPSYEDFSAALSDAPSFSSDYPPPSNRNSLMSSTQLSPVASPRMTPQGRSELVRTQSRGRASPSPRPGLRAAPYSVEGARNKRWSTGSYGTMPSRRPSPFVFHGANGVGTSGALEPFGPRLATASAHQSSPTTATGQLPLNMTGAGGMVPSQNPFFLSANPQAAAAAAAAAGYNRHSMLLPTQLPSQAGAMAFHHPHMDGGFGGGHHLAAPHHPGMVGHGLHPHTIPSHMPLGHLGAHPHHGMQAMHGHHHPGGPFDAAQAPMMSLGLFRMLQSNGDPHAMHGHYTDLSDPPDLYASLHEEQLLPPLEDMNPSDPDLVPHEQELRFTGDLYTPKWVRGHGNKREGWCGICKPGRWLVLKNSAFWYDKSFTHGISAATGNPFQEPLETRRMDGNPDVWEGLCSSCNDWIALVSSKKKGTTWFRHAYKCHTHPKIKDAPKRRRESGHTRIAGTTTVMTGMNGMGGIAGVGGMVKAQPENHHGAEQQQQQQQQQQAAATSTAQQMPQTPLTPQLTPVAAVATTAMPLTAATTQMGVSHVQVQMPVPVSMAMSGLAVPSTAEQMMAQQQQQQQSSPVESNMQQSDEVQGLQGQQERNPQQAVEQAQQAQQTHQAQFTHSPPLHPPPSHPPPPVPPRSHLRIQQQMAQLGAMQQQQQQQRHQQHQQQLQQHQQRTMQHVRPPPPPPPPAAITRQMMTPMTPMTPIEGLGNMI